MVFEMYLNNMHGYICVRVSGRPSQLHWHQEFASVMLQALLQLVLQCFAQAYEDAIQLTDTHELWRELSLHHQSAAIQPCKQTTQTDTDFFVCFLY